MPAWRRSKTETVNVHHPNGGYEYLENTWNSDGSEIHSRYLVLGEQEYELVTYRKKSGATSEHEYLTNISDADVEDFKKNFERPPQKTKIEKIEDQTTEGEKTEKKKPWFGWFGWGPKKDQDTSSDDED